MSEKPFDQHDLSPVRVVVDAGELERVVALIERLGDRGRAVAAEVVEQFATRVYKGARSNLSGPVLAVRTGRLRGALAMSVEPGLLAREIEDDVFYGAVHEGTEEEPGAHPWMAPAVAEAGGVKGFADALETALQRAVNEAEGIA